MSRGYSNTRMRTVRVPLRGRIGRGKHVLVDAADAERITQHRWWLSSCRGKPAYANAEINGRRVALHRWLLDLRVGDPMCVDHINGDPLDCRRSNLRACTPAENSRNSAALYGERTGLKGVTPYGERFRAEIRAGAVHRCLGYFDTAEEAALAYDEACRELHGEFALTNADAGLLPVAAAEVAA